MVSQVKALIEKEIKRLEKRLAVVRDLVDGQWDSKLFYFERESIRLVQEAPDTKACLKIIEERKPEREALKAKAKKAKNTIKLIEEQVDLEYRIENLKWEGAFR